MRQLPRSFWEEKRRREEVQDSLKGSSATSNPKNLAKFPAKQPANRPTKRSCPAESPESSFQFASIWLARKAA